MNRSMIEARPADHARWARRMARPLWLRLLLWVCVVAL